MAYNAAFFESQAPTSRASAERIAPILVAQLAPASVVDVGCGVGTWLAAFAALGVKRVLGIDGDYVARSDLQIGESSFVAHDLSQPLDIDGRYDLAVSLEVAEHLPPERSASFIAELTALAPAVLFSAAIPDQGGVGHTNERWQDEWAALFAVHGFTPRDIIRAKVWGDSAVEPWYAQNTFLYTREVAAETSPMPLRVVHPAVFSERLAFERQQRPKLAEAALELGRATGRSLSHRFHRLRSSAGR